MNQTHTWQNWLLIGARIALLILLAILLNTPLVAASQDTPVLFGLGVIAILALVVPILLPKLQRLMPFLIVVGDAIALALYAPLFVNAPVWQLSLATLLMLTAFIPLNYVWAGLEAVVLCVICGLAGQSAATVLPAIIAVSIAAWLYEFSSHSNMDYSASQARAMEQAKNAQAQDMRGRARTVSNVAEVMSTSLNYEKVLFAAMNAGTLALRDLSSEPRMTCAVMLYQATDSDLHVIYGRGLTMSDQRLTIPGQNGIVGQALQTCLPVISGLGRKDPELAQFVGFQKTRSTLCIPLRAGYENYGVLVFGTEEPDMFVQDHFELLAAVGTQATIALQNAVLYENLLRERDRIIEVEEDTRKKLAADLHDGPTQVIAAITMRASIIAKMLERNPKDVPKELQKIEEMARQATKDIRTMLFTLRPLTLENKGLSAALQQLVQKMQETYNQRVNIIVDRHAEKSLDSHQQGMVFYIIEEAVNNARKHAKASLIAVKLSRRQDDVLVEVIDNGVGFDTTRVLTNYEERGSFGMVNLRERSAVLGAALDIQSTPGRGTHISILIPRITLPSETSPNMPINLPSTGTASKLAQDAIKRSYNS